MDIVSQHRNEISRVVLDGRRTDDGAACSVVVVRESGGTWAIYPHGMDQLGARLRDGELATMTRAILAAAP